ncbi:MAG: AAA family ATPase [Phycisphaeraceae bacterium]
MTLTNDFQQVEQPQPPRRGPILIRMSDVKERPVKWLWQDRIPLGKITMLVGRPGNGKSFLTIDMAARVSLGRPWPDGTACPKGSVIMLCGEDGPDDTIRPRLNAIEADAERVVLLEGAFDIDDNDDRKERLITLSDITYIEDALKQNRDCKLLVVDPIGTYIGGKTDANRDNEVRAQLSPLAELAKWHEVAVVVVAHHRKSLTPNADDMTMGSVAFSGIARAVWHVVTDSEKKDRRLLLPGKMNLGPRPDGLAFKIGGIPVCISWEQEPVCMTANEAMAAQLKADRAAASNKRGPKSEALDEAKEFLVELLKNGPVAIKEVKGVCEKNEISWGTVRRARIALELVTSSIDKVQYWQLPEPEMSARVPEQDENLRIARLQQSNNVSPSVSTEQVRSAQVSEQSESSRDEAKKHGVQEATEASPSEQIDGDSSDMQQTRIYSADMKKLLVALAIAIESGQLSGFNPLCPDAKPRVGKSGLELLGNLSKHESELTAVYRGEGLPQRDDETEAGVDLAERLAVLETDGIPTHVGSPAWLRAIAEVLPVHKTHSLTVP